MRCLHSSRQFVDRLLTHVIGTSAEARSGTLAFLQLWMHCETSRFGVVQASPWTSRASHLSRIWSFAHAPARASGLGLRQSQILAPLWPDRKRQTEYPDLLNPHLRLAPVSVHWPFLSPRAHNPCSLQ